MTVHHHTPPVSGIPPQLDAEALSRRARLADPGPDDLRPDPVPTPARPLPASSTTPWKILVVGWVIIIDARLGLGIVARLLDVYGQLVEVVAR